ncbi:MAG TPA: 50S ribosomal protein L21 [Nitrospiraceae bacterium]|nr:50S ribosomal protein L21 [Nitrospiraceae bacterium]
MYAIIETGGKQYRVSPGEIIKVSRLNVEPPEAGGTVEFEKVLMVSDGTKVAFGSPFLSSAKVTADILGQAKAKKVLVFKQKPRKGYRNLKGHRQAYTSVRIKDIVYGG